MTTKYNLPGSSALLVLLILCSSLFSNCYSFKKGYHKFKSGQPEKAAKIFQKKLGHPIWDEGAITYLEFIKLQNARTLQEWQQSDSVLCSVSQKLDKMPISKKRMKLNQYEVNSRNLNARLANIQSAAIEAVRASGRISGLDSLLDHFPCWQRQDSLQKFTREIVNETLSGSSGLENRSENCHLTFPCFLGDHLRQCDPNNQPPHPAGKTRKPRKFWRIKKDSWEIFREQAPPYCDMDRFQNDYPDHPYAKRSGMTQPGRRSARNRCKSRWRSMPKIRIRHSTKIFATTSFALANSRALRRP